MIRQLLTGFGGALAMGAGALCAVLAVPVWAGALAGGLLVVAGAAAMSWAVGW
jgi:predicted phage tail protein